MYESYWSLAERPFESEPDARFFFPSETHQAALLKLRYLVENRKEAGMIVGASGTGKTCVLQMLSEQLPATNRPFVRLVFPQLTPAELLAYLAVELGGTADGQGLDRTLLEIQRLLRHYAERGQQPVIVIDEAHLIDDPLVFQALRLLLNFQQPQSGLAFSLILSGQPELLPRLARMPQLDERITAKSLLRALSFEETVAYVSHRLAAGGVDRPVFDPAALQTLFELSGGIPRRINRLCDLGLLVGYADNSPRIAPEQLEAVHEDLCATAA